MAEAMQSDAATVEIKCERLFDKAAAARRRARELERQRCWDAADAARREAERFERNAAEVGGWA